MEIQTCTSCQKIETGVACGLCAEATCKDCAIFLESDAFAFLRQRPEGLEGDTYCQGCFANRVAPELEAYEVLVERAREIDVYYKNQSKETRLISRKEKAVAIKDCDDRDELVLRLAFQAALGGFNTVVDIDLKPIKVAQGGRYRKFMWNGSGIPTNARKSKSL